MRLIVIILLALLALPGYSQFWKRKVNQLDENGKKHGHWIEYMDSEHKAISGKGRFEHGRETGKWKHYHFNGKRRLKYKYLRDDIKVKYYYPNGRLEQKGRARIEYSEKDVHYYWEGEWRFYDEKHRLQRIVLYGEGVEGVVVWTRNAEH
jgi:antitoxin component YwqK of YwqJK toxin-antitoxin module